MLARYWTMPTLDLLVADGVVVGDRWELSLLVIVGRKAALSMLLLPL